MQSKASWQARLLGKARHGLVAKQRLVAGQDKASWHGKASKGLVAYKDMKGIVASQGKASEQSWRRLPDMSRPRVEARKAKARPDGKARQCPGARTRGKTILVLVVRQGLIERQGKASWQGKAMPRGEARQGKALE
jgi:hypothetical protein